MKRTHREKARDVKLEVTAGSVVVKDLRFEDKNKNLRLEDKDRD